ncbi:ABC transporter permease [Algisphaera agarilytica]|uniref:Ribose/xylose/arabinose/galactoside ABC-type transport system permease subunit n=1 Tax=Algisphaera agarilytica TaxID=1385975 RepID=A0A7X0LKC4_9BACT|nr:ABC transporter permease [Algisphaera agarilytica]MBB6429496.1 ribose/xylose/arabinose/galactoside ABC-type transport system permease subunit [Algisphaera agarilytica]
MKLKPFLYNMLPFVGLVFVIVVSMIAIQIKDPSGEDLANFMSFDNIRTVLIQTVVVGIAALGMTLVIISAGIDLSVGSQIALATVVFAFVVNGGSVTPPEVDSASGLAVTLAILATIGACGLCGLFNGWISSKFRIVPFIVTLGTMLIFRGVAKWIAGGEAVRTPKNAAQGFMDYDGALGIGIGFYLLIASIIVTAVLLKRTVLGRYIYAIGSSENTARLCGIGVENQKVFIYVLCGVFTGLAGVMQYSFLGSGNPTIAVGLELNIIAAVVIGGGSLNGGSGSAMGTFIGALIMSILGSTCTMLGAETYVQEMTIGSIVIIAVGIDRLKHLKRFQS